MIKLFVCLSLIGFVVCYDFQDSYFNEMLMHDYLEMNEVEPSFLARVRRDTTKPEDDKCKRQHHKGNKCCNDGADNTANLEKMKEIKKQCFAEIRGGKSVKSDEPVDMFSCEKMNKTKQDIVCAMECTGKKQDILDAQGNLAAQDKLAAFVTENFASADWQKPLTEDFVAKCSKEVKEKETPLEAGKCNPAASQFGYCMWRHFTLACPQDKQEQSKKCDKLREKMNNNEYVSFHHSKHDSDD